MWRLSVGVPQGTWGEQGIEWSQEVLHCLKPARLWFPGKEPGTHCSGEYMTATRQEADLMALDDFSAMEEVARGPERRESLFLSVVERSFPRPS